MKIDLNDKLVRFLVQEYVNPICNYASEDELNFNVHKLIHTFQVVEMAEKLIKKTIPALSPKIKKHILYAALLHDLGRCHEFKNGKHLKHIDHGKIGKELIQKYFPRMTIEADTTFFHNKLPSAKDPKSCQPVLDYVRDADMLANMKYQINNTEIFLVHIWEHQKKNLLTPVIDKEIFQAAKKMEPVQTSKIKVKSILTMWLWELCWFFNLKTSAGIKCAQEEKIFIKFKQTIFKKIVPLTTRDKKKQKELIQKIQETFPDRLFK